MGKGWRQERVIEGEYDQNMCYILYILKIYENAIMKHTTIFNLNMLKRMLVWRLGMYLSARMLA